MPSTPAQSLPALTYLLVRVVDYDTDGITPDSTEALTVQADNGAVVSAAVTPGDNRVVKITALAGGVGLSTTVRIGAPGVTSANMLLVPVTVMVPPNLARIDLAVDGIQGPFAV